MPFSVQTPLLDSDVEPSVEKLDRIVCRSGDCVEAIKKDPEFNGFLSGVIGNFEAFE